MIGVVLEVILDEMSYVCSTLKVKRTHSENLSKQSPPRTDLPLERR